MGGQGPVPGKGQKGPQGLLLRGSSLQHLVGDAGKTDNFRGQNPLRRDKGIEGIGDLPVFQHHRADFNNDLIFSIQAGGLNIKTDNFLVEGGVHRPVDGHPVVHIVNKIGLHPIQNLNFLSGVPGVGEGLGHTVVGDGDGRMSPGLRPLDYVLVRAQLGCHTGEGVHGGHGGMKVELHPLFRGGVLLHFFLRRGNGHRLQHHVAIEPIHAQPALNLDMHPFLDAVHQGLALLAGKKLVHPDGAGVVGHVKGHHPGPPLFQLPVVDGEDVPLHHHHAHVQLQLSDWGGGLGNCLAEDGLSLGLFVLLGGGGGAGAAFQRRLSDGLCAGKGVVNFIFILVYILRALVLQGFGVFRNRFVNLFIFMDYRLFFRLNLHAVQAIGPANRLLRLSDKVGARSGGSFHGDFGAAAGLVDGGGHDPPALHPVGQLGPLAQGGKHL